MTGRGRSGCAGLALADPILCHGPGGPVPQKEGLPRARAAALKALEFDPNDSDALFVQTWALYETGLFDQAIETARKLAAVNHTLWGRSPSLPRQLPEDAALRGAPARYAAGSSRPPRRHPGAAGLRRRV